MLYTKLADELLLKIFQEIQPIVSELKTLRLVCKRWNSLFNDDFLWKFYFHKYISSDTCTRTYFPLDKLETKFNYQERFKYVFMKCRKLERKGSFPKLFLFIITFGFDKLLQQILFQPQNSPFQCNIINPIKDSPQLVKRGGSPLPIIRRNPPVMINHSRKTPPLPSKLPTHSHQKPTPIHLYPPSFSLPPPPLNNVHKSNLQNTRQYSLPSPIPLSPSLIMIPDNNISFIEKNIRKIQNDPELLISNQYTVEPFNQSIFHIIAENHFVSMLIQLFNFFGYYPQQSTQEREVESNAYLDVNKAKQSVLENRVRILLNYQDERGRTPLFISAKLGYADMIHLLVTPQNIHYHTINKEGVKTILHIASENGSFFVLNLLLSILSSPEYAVHKNQLLNQVSSTNQTALHYAAQSGHIHCAELLLKHNIDRNIQSNSVDKFLFIKGNSSEFTAEQIALEMGYKEIHELIKSYPLLKNDDHFYTDTRERVFSESNQNLFTLPLFVLFFFEVSHLINYYCKGRINYIGRISEKY